MDQNQQLTNAILFATQKHHGQIDKAGMPYILHPLAVMNKVQTIDAKIVAVLHDVIEDTDATKEDLKELGIEQELIEAILLLTHEKEMSYEVYIKRIKEANNLLAIEVKCADLMHNSDETRLKEITIKDQERIQKYKKALKYLRES